VTGAHVRFSPPHALVADALGFTGLARAASAVAKIVFVVFLLLALLLLLLLWGGVQLFNG
jgi:uncharacterized membrane protein YtjA (UPF0391 family)